ncbi:glycosyltransferase family 4 protein [Spirosoma taeanense]|uniref:Glycosyltransferase family 4 protein n=1 Tax=Spirosoma taeanense TaxID=2735870 RepID=A0A6M5Y3Q6_9BACT|nr:glycosyltransferase family 4 protein [Spirosoma taeanense]QJW88010.1 glycosyltransferase family 4 protein [Spirosoma taeanense]
MTISTDGGAFYKSAIIWLIASLFIKKRIVMLHEKGIAVTAQKNSFNRFLASQMLSKSSLVVTSAYLLSEFEGYATPKFVVSSGTPGTSFSRPDVTTQQFKPRLLFMSNLLVEKGVLVFINICKALADRHFDFTAVIVGKEADVSIRQLTALIQQYQLQHYVSIVGPKYDEDRDECLRNADLLIFPTFYKRETTPLVIQEAFKFGVIPIASSEGAIADMIDHKVDGFIIDPANIGCYCDKIILLSQNKALLNAFRAAGRKKFDTRFRLALFEENLTNVLDITLNNKPA